MDIENSTHISDRAGTQEEPRESDSLLEPPNLSEETERRSVRKRLLLYSLPALLLCQFAIGFDGSYVIGNYSRRIASDLHDFQNSRWLVLGFLVTESSFAPLYGHASQVYGYRRSILFAVLLLVVGLFLCSLSDHLWQVSLSRAIVGVGTAGIELLVIVAINDLVQLYELPLWTSATVACSTAGLMLGGPVGSALTSHFGFRLTFGIECCGMIIIFVLLYFTLRLPKIRVKRPEHTAPRIEYCSAVLLLASVAAPLFALNLGGDVIAWSHPVVIILFCSTPALIMLFSYAEKRIATVPMVPSRLIKNRNVAIAFVCTLPMKFVFDQLRFSFGTYLEARALGKESSFGDWALSAVYLGRLFGTIGGGILIRRYRKFKKFLQLNILVDFIIYLCLASGFMHLEQPVFAPVLVFIGATEGFAESLWLVAVLSLVDSDDQPLLYAFFGLSLAVAGDLGIAISLAAEGNLVRMKLNDQLHNYPNAAEIIRRSLEDLNYVRQLPDDLQVMVINALLSSIEIAFGASCIMLVISLISSFWMKEMSSLSRGYSYVS